MKWGTIKQVLSGDSVKIWGPPRPNGPPLEKQLSLFGVIAPKLERRPVNDTKSSTKDEPWAWEAREFLRKKLIGCEVLFKVQATIGNVEKGTIILGKDEATGVNINELMVSEGLVTVRGDAKNEDIIKLRELEEIAKSQGKGRHGNPTKPGREVHWTHDRDVEKYDGRPLKAIIEHVRDGSTVRAFIQPDDNNVFYYITLMISGIRCTNTKTDPKGKDGEQDDVGDQDEAKYCVERHLLQRDCHIVLATMNNNNFIGSVIHPHGNIAEVLLKRGFAKCVEWSLPYVKGSKEILALREAEKYAKDRRVGIWKDYVPSTPAIPAKDKEFTGTVIEIVNGDCVYVKQQSGTVKKLFLSSIRPPKAKNTEENKAKPKKDNRPLYDIPWMYEARECLRKLLIGKKVNVVVDYIQPIRESLPEKICCTVLVGKTNAALELVGKGLAQVVRHRQDDDQRSSQYNSLLEAEMKAQKANLGIHNTKENPVKKVNIIADAQKAKLSLPTLMRHDKQEAIVEFVTSGSRLRLFIPKDSCIVTFLLSGISCPRGARMNMTGTGAVQEAEPFGEDALNFTREKCMHRDVHITVQSMDKNGSFIGWLFVDNVNLSVALVKEGLATVHSTAERSEHKNSLREAEKYAKQNMLNIWKDYIDTPKDDDRHEEDKVTERKVNFEKIIITDITPEGRFYAQNSEQGPKLEALMSKLRQEFSTEPLPGAYTPKKGDLCAAKFTFDSQWYRAKIEKVQGQKVSVRYIDYGNREDLPIGNCAALPPTFISDKPYATEYALACVNFPSTENDHRDAALAAFSDDVLNKPLLMNVENKGAIPEVSLMDTSNIDIVKNLLAEGLLIVQNRRERRLQKLLSEYKSAQETAKKSRLAIWEYGDITEDDM